MTREEWMYITSLRQLEKLEPVEEKTWSILTMAINSSYREKAIKYAEVIRDAWKA